MALKHADIWRAVDKLAENKKLSPSGLAKKAGLSPTVFNPSKRVSASRKRWPSTESIARILEATGTSLDEFLLLATPEATGSSATLPLLNFSHAGRAGYFDEDGHPTDKGWDKVRFPALSDPHAFMLEISGKNLEPVYREGNRLVLSPAEKPRRGDRVVVRTKKGEILVRELGRETAQKTELISLNPGGPGISVQTSTIEWLYRIIWASQ